MRYFIILKNGHNFVVSKSILVWCWWTRRWISYIAEEYHEIEEDSKNNQIFNLFNNDIILKKDTKIDNDKEIWTGTLKIFRDENAMNTL